ncbi:DUF285 domain-containing protein [Helicobacter suis]|nr:DUF285 domain-containing protein [Helicobacter suis]
MRKMFFYAKSFNYPLNHWDTTHVLDMYKMFAYTKNFNQDLSTWNLHRADSRCMFLHATGMHSFFPRAFFETSSSCS